MTNQVLFVQGAGRDAHAWDQKLVLSLQRELGQDYEVRFPTMPDEGNPSYEKWQSTLERELQALSRGAVVVGHSVGGTFVTKLLAESAPVQGLSAIVLIAPPFVGDGGWPSDELELPADLGARLPAGVHIFHGTDDDVVPVAHADLYARAVPHARVHRLQGRDHQLNDDLKDVAAIVVRAR